MNLKMHTRLTANLLALLCAAYLPQANAQLTDFGKISVPGSRDLVNNDIPTGAFTDTYKFSIASGATLSSAAVSFSWTVDSTDPNEIGAGLSVFNLDGSNGQVITVGKVTSIYDGYDANSELYGYTYKGVISNTNLTANTSYSIVISGDGGSYNGPVTIPGYGTYYAPGFYTGTLTIAVPEPQEWLMLILGLSLVGWKCRSTLGKGDNLTPMFG